MVAVPGENLTECCAACGHRFHGNSIGAMHLVLTWRWPWIHQLVRPTGRWSWVSADSWCS